MKKFVRPSEEELQQFRLRFRGKSVDEIIALLGQPARELGTSSQERRYENGRIETVEFSRSVEIVGVSDSISRLIVRQRTNGKLEIEYHSKEVADDPPNG